LKKELIRRQSWPSRRELTGEVFDYIETFYNHRRRHSTLGYLSLSRAGFDGGFDARFCPRRRRRSAHGPSEEVPQRAA